MGVLERVRTGSEVQEMVIDAREVAGAESGEFAIETRGLTKRYGDRITAVDRVSLRVRQGEVYGFLGPNGSGKTTTLRMLLGLVKPTAGEAVVLGERPGTSRGLSRIGAMVETPAFYPFLSGWDNLRALAMHGGVPEEQIFPALEAVELVDRAGDKFGTYSLGMKQRLGVAAALMKNPELLILDEPTNGLDPAGMAEMRTLIRNLGQGKRTVLLSSHLMGEVEQVCDRVGIIRKGQLVVEGTVDSLRGGDILRVRAEPLDEARRLVTKLPGVERVTAADGSLRIAGKPNAATINRALVEAEIAVSEIFRERSSLEDVFLELTQDDQGQPGEAKVEEREVAA